MNKQWPTVKLGEITRDLTQTRTFIVQPDDVIVDPTIQSATHRISAAATSRGFEVKVNKRIKINHGDLVFSRLHTQNGAFAFSDGNFQATGTFLPLAIIEEKADQRFLFWALHQFVPSLSASDTVGRETYKTDDILALEIPLPPLTEQKRVVARIEELSAQIQEARTLRQKAKEEGEALLRSILTHDEQSKPTPMRELVKLRPPDVTVCAEEIYQFAGVYCFGRGVFKSVQKSGIDFAYPRLTRLRAGEFVYPKLMAWEGAFGVVPPECDGCVVSTEFPVFEVNQKRVLPEVLDTYFRTPSVWPEIAGKSTGTNIRRRRLNPQDFLDYEMPLPSMETQMTLRKVRAEVDALKRMQAETAEELDALLPSILDKAFKGEL